MHNLLKKLTELKAAAWLSLIVIYVASLTGWWWLWGVLLLAWGFTNMLNEETWVSETVRLARNPVLYFLVIITWLTSGFYFLIGPVTQLLGY